MCDELKLPSYYVVTSVSVYPAHMHVWNIGTSLIRRDRNVWIISFVFMVVILKLTQKPIQFRIFHDFYVACSLCTTGPRPPTPPSLHSMSLLHYGLNATDPNQSPHFLVECHWNVFYYELWDIPQARAIPAIWRGFGARRPEFTSHLPHHWQSNKRDINR